MEVRRGEGGRGDTATQRKRELGERGEGREATNGSEPVWILSESVKLDRPLYVMGESPGTKPGWGRTERDRMGNRWRGRASKRWMTG